MAAALSTIVHRSPDLLLEGGKLPLPTPPAPRTGDWSAAARMTPGRPPPPLNWWLRIGIPDCRWRRNGREFAAEGTWTAWAPALEVPTDNRRPRETGGCAAIEAFDSENPDPVPPTRGSRIPGRGADDHRGLASGLQYRAAPRRLGRVLVAVCVAKAPVETAAD